MIKLRLTRHAIENRKTLIYVFLEKLIMAQDMPQTSQYMKKVMGKK
jgi:hypothetical protein